MLFSTNVERVKRMEETKYYSQYKQDKILNENIFKNQRGGVFVDVGAHNGIDISNTYFFEKELGWKGICIEPMQKCYDELVKNRKCICYNGCAYNQNGEVPFRINEGYTEMLSGIENCYPAEHKRRIQNELMERGGSTHLIQVPARTLQNLFDEHNITVVDYLTVDTEGSEFEVFQGIDFSKTHINVIDFEENYPQYARNIYELLLKNGFVFRGKIDRDTVFINSNIKFSWDKTE